VLLLLLLQQHGQLPLGISADCACSLLACKSIVYLLFSRFYHVSGALRARSSGFKLDNASCVVKSSGLWRA
jgi:hypothetical protein